MWALQQPGPGVFAKRTVECPQEGELASGELLLRFLAGGICGSDIPKFLGQPDVLGQLGPYDPNTAKVGTPLHEFVGVVEHSHSTEFEPGTRVVGRLKNGNGLAEYVINPAEFMVRVDNDLDDLTATIVQPLATVLSALDRIPSISGREVAILGLGPMGLLFAHVLSSLGAKRVVGVDRIDRTNLGPDFRLDEVVIADASQWASGLGIERFSLVIDAIGHSQEVLADAVEALEVRGHLLVYGLPNEHYVLPFRKFFQKNLTLHAAHTLEWSRYLKSAQEHLLRAPRLRDSFVTHTYSIEQAQDAFRTATLPTVGRIKVAITRPDSTF